MTWKPGVPLVVGALLLLATSGGAAEAPAVLEVGSFSTEKVGVGLPEGWKPLTFKKVPKPTAYELVADDQTVVVKAVSEGGASGLTREITISLQEYPIVQWRWKVANVLQKGDVSKKAGDDYPARLYITFEYKSELVGWFDKAKYETINLLYGQYPPLNAINYIWESTAPKGTMRPNPYTDKVIMFVVESGRDRLNTWVTEERNLYQDYKRAFGMDPPPISGVAIMTDTDNTQESAVAYYGDIVFKKQ